MKKDFDLYSKNYEDRLDEAVRITGYDGNYFAEAKLKKLSMLFPEWTRSSFNFLDYGCGKGLLFSKFHSYFPEGNYVGTDFSNEMIQEARAKHPHTESFFEFESKEWKKFSYDVVFAAGVFHHIPAEDHETIIKELSGLLSEKGEIILWEHNPMNPFTRNIVKDCVFDKDAVLIPSKHLKHIFENTPLERVRIIYTTFFPKFLNALLPLENFLGWLPLGGQYLIIGDRPKEKERV